MRTNVYVDGFNLYYRALKRSPQYRWLDLSKLCALLLRGHSINRIRYFTALVKARPDDPQQQQRQQAYLRALRTIPNLTVHEGLFLTNPRLLPLAAAPHKVVRVLRTEEKGSDVNLATCLLVDGFKKDYETAVVISNDSDLISPIQAVRTELGRQVGVVNPDPDASRSALPADFYRRVRRGPLHASQFPDVLTDAHGTIRRPQEW